MRQQFTPPASAPPNSARKATPLKTMGFLAACIAACLSTATSLAAWETRTADGGAATVAHGEAPELLSISCTGDAKIVILTSKSLLDAPFEDRPNAHILQFLFDSKPAVVAAAASRWAINPDVVESILNDPTADEDLKESVRVRSYQVFFQNDEDEARFFRLLKRDSRLSIGGDIDGTTRSIREISLSGSSAALTAGGC